MIDIHCHILPGVDDGPGKIEESVEMCRIAEADGIKVVVATPHYNPGKYEFPLDRINRAKESLEEELYKNDISLKLLLGSDVSITPETHKDIESKPEITIGGDRKYILAEFHDSYVPPNWESYLLSLIPKGTVPILTHPERNKWFMDHPLAMETFAKNGGLVQISAMSLTGEFGYEIQDVTINMLENSLVHIIATDAHSVEHRPPLLSDSLKVAEDIIGSESARKMVFDNPASVIKGLPLSPFSTDGAGQKHLSKSLKAKTV